MTHLSAIDRDGRIPFYEDDYFRHDLSRGTLFNRSGTKMCFLPSELLLALKQVLEEETGDATFQILYRVGRIWGRRTARRFQKEITDFYNRPLFEIPVQELAKILEGYFSHHGWGRLALEFEYAESGFISARLDNSAFVEIIGTTGTQVDSIVCGLLSEFFCQLSERNDIECVETECASSGSPSCRFVVGLNARLEPVHNLMSKGRSHEEIMNFIAPQEEPANDLTREDTQELAENRLP